MLGPLRPWRRRSLRAAPAPVHGCESVVGRPPDQDRDSGGDSRHRPHPVPAHRSSDAWRARRRTRVLGEAAATPADPARLVTMRELDAQLVGALGLQPAARRIRIGVRDAGLAADLDDRHRDRGPPARPPAQPPAGLGRSRAAAVPAGHPGRGRVFVRTRAGSSHRVRSPGSTSSPRRSRSPSSTTGRGPCSAGSPVRRLPVRVGRHLREDPAALERHGAGRNRHRPGRVRLLRIRVARLQDEAVRGSAAARRNPQGADDLRDERRGDRSPPGSRSPTSQPGDVLFFGSLGARSAPAQVGHPASTSGTAGSCTRRARASRCSRSRGGTRRRSPGPAGRSPKPGSPLGSPACEADRVAPLGPARRSARVDCAPPGGATHSTHFRHSHVT